MKLSDLQQIINDKEDELAKMRKAAADAAQHQEEEVRGQMLQVLESMELEMQQTRHESDLAIRDAIQRVESDAAATTEQARKEMELELQQREEDIFKVAGSKIEEEWVLREEYLHGEFKLILSNELGAQHDKLTAHYEAIIQEKDEAMNAQANDATKQISEMEKEHQYQLKAMSEEMEQAVDEAWKEACEKFGSAADEEISHSLAMAEEQCKARDEQISALLEERSMLQEELREKASQAEESISELGKMEIVAEEAVAKMRYLRDEEVEKISEDAMCLLNDNRQLNEALNETSADNGVLKEEVSRCRLKHKELETQHSQQQNAASVFNNEKQVFESRIKELAACKELLERQLSDSKDETKELTIHSDQLKKEKDELASTNKQLASKITELNSNALDLQTENNHLKHLHSETAAKVKSLKQERKDSTNEMDDRLKQKDRLLAETLESMKYQSHSRQTEPVVVHLHGTQGDKANSSPSDTDRLLASECTNLRSKVLQLQRENFRLESELMGLKKGENASKQSNASGSQHDKRGKMATLQQENKSLKTMLSMMRKEMETAASDNDTKEEGGDKASLHSEVVLERQLMQCRSYLDLLLKDGASADGEAVFLRAKYQELHETVNDLRDENARLHMMCNKNVGNEECGFGATARDQELIQRLEEATDEIEYLLSENEKLIQLSNELRFELANTKPRYAPTTSEDFRRPPDQGRHVDIDENEQTMLDAILTDQSRSCCDSESQESEVACVGRRPPITNASDYRPSKTAYGTRPRTASDRATASQEQSLQRMLNRKKREVAVEKTKIRNWNVKDLATNPYL